MDPLFSLSVAVGRVLPVGCLPAILLTASQVSPSEQLGHRLLPIHPSRAA